MINRITQIELKNFQSHKHTVIDSDTPVLVLSGESHNGKTVIIRALSWLVTNRPTGDGFVSHWAKHENKKGVKVMTSDAECSVSMSFMDDKGTMHEVSRHKTSTSNWYVVDGIKLSAIGTDVPKEVTNLFCLNDTNIQNQDEPYFMLNLSGSQVSAKLNELVHLDTIDEAYTYTKKAKLDASADYKHAEKEYNVNKLNALGYAYIPDMRADYDEVSGLVEKYERLSDKLEGMEGLGEEASALKARLKALPNLEAMAPDMRIIENALKKITELDDLRDSIRDARYDLTSVLDDLSDLPKVEGRTVEALGTLLEKHAETLALCLALDKHVRTLSMVESDLRGLHVPVDAESDLAKVKSLIAAHGKSECTAQAMADHVSEIERISKKKGELPTIDESALKELRQKIKEHGRLESMNDDLYGTIVKASQVKRALNENEKELVELEGELPDRCPLCGQPMDKEHHHA